MKKFKLLSCIALLAAAFPAYSATYYISDCQSGAQPGCVAGSSGNNGTTTTTPKQFFSQLPTLVSGDVVNWANGGKWAMGTTTMNLTVTTTPAATYGNITFQGYSHPSFPNAVKPWLVWTGNDGIVQSGRGYLIKDLKLDGSGTADSAFKLPFNGSYLKGDNLEITGWSVGTGGDNGGTNYWITRSDVHNNSFGYLADLNNVIVEYSDYHANAPSTGNSEHNFYVGGNSGFGNGNFNIVVRFNRFYDQGGMNGLAANNCITSSVTAHGKVRGYSFYNNTLWETQQTSDGCTMVEFNNGDAETGEGMLDINVYNNLIYISSIRSSASFGKLIAVDACVGCTIENNVLAILPTNASDYAMIGVGAGSAGDTISSRITIRNNTMYMGSGLDDGSRGISIAGTISGVTVVGNIVYQASNSFSYCYFSTMSAVNFTEWNYNLCYKAGTSGEYSNFAVALSNAQSQGFDTNGKNTNPLFVTVPPTSANLPGSLQIQSGSPAKDACASVRCSRLSYKGYIPLGTRDIGAYEYGRP